jgi:hypothetical protein
VGGDAEVSGNVLTRVANEMRVAAMSTGDRAFHHLRDAAATGGEITLSAHELVLAISQALWARELATAQLGLSELEVRTALTVPDDELKEAA